MLKELSLLQCLLSLLQCLLFLLQCLLFLLRCLSLSQFVLLGQALLSYKPMLELVAIRVVRIYIAASWSLCLKS